MKLEAVNSVKLIHSKGYEQDGNNQGHKYYTPAIRNRSLEAGSDSSGSYEERSRSYQQSPNQLKSSPSRNGTNATNNPALQLILKLKKDKKDRQKALHERQLNQLTKLEAKTK